jgi:selenium-binding protein 1
VIDVKEPLKAKIHKIIEPEEVFAKTGYSRPHTIHCGPEGIYVSTLGGGGEDGTDGPPGIFIMDCETFDILGRYEMDRGKQDKHYDFWWNLPRDYMVSSEWGLPPQFENGIVPEDLLSNKYGHTIHFWNLRERATCRPSTWAKTTRWRWKSGLRMTRPRNTGSAAWWWTPPTCKGRSSPGGRRTTARSRPRRPSPSTRGPKRRRTCRRFCRASSAVPPLVTDIDLSLDDKYLYVACWGLGEMHQYDVSDPMNPKLAGKVEIGGIARGDASTPTARISSTARRWSRSAATASGSTGPTRSTRHGTTSSIRARRGRPDGHGRMSAKTAA